MLDEEAERIQALERLLDRVDETCREAEDVRDHVRRSMARRAYYPESPLFRSGSHEPPDNDQSP